jgi:hypothetical protein
VSDWDEITDLVIVGSGGGALCAALAAHDAGLRSLVIEKQPMVGGSTAVIEAAMRCGAAGNCTASVVDRCYPGLGASIGASFIFGWIAARHASGTA